MTGAFLAGGSAITSFLWDGVGRLAPVLAAIAIQGTAVLLLTSALAWGLRHRSAAVRHLVWSVGLAALVVIPVAGSVLPSWSGAAVRRTVVGDGGPSAPGFLDALLSSGTAVETPGSAATPPAPGAPAGGTARGEGTSGVVPRSEKPEAPAPEGPPPSTRGASGKGIGLPRTAGLRAASVLYLSVTAGLLLLAAWARGTIRRRLAGAERPAPDGSLAERVRRCAREAGVRREVRIRVGGGFGVPLVVGTLRPILHLPAGVRRWPEARLRAALLHELAHVRRGDGCWNLAADLACALHWWNPLAWTAARRARLECERACDDRVVRSGVRPSEYGAHLLWLAGGWPAPWWGWAATGVTGPSRLSRRIDALADGSRPRGGIGWAGGLAAGALGLAVLPLAILTPVAAGGRDGPSARREAPLPPARTPAPTRPAAGPVSSDATEGDAPVQARWSGPEGAGAVFLRGSVRLSGEGGSTGLSEPSLRAEGEVPAGGGRSGAGGASDGSEEEPGVFLLFHVGSGGALGSLRAHPGPDGRLRRYVRDAEGLRPATEGFLAGETSWIADVLASAGRRLAGRGASVVWRGAPLGRVGEPRGGPGSSGSVMTGLPAVSRDPGNGTFVASWLRDGRRLGTFGRRRGADDRVPDPARLRDGEWLVAFSWDPAARELRIVEASGRRDGPPRVAYSVDGEPRGYGAAERAWVARLLPELARLLEVTP